MATDQEDGPVGSTIPAGSSNAVPQGPQRRTTNLESASLRKEAGSTGNRQPSLARLRARRLSLASSVSEFPRLPSLSDSSSLGSSHRPGRSPSLSTSTSLSRSRSLIFILSSLSNARRDTC